MPYLGTVVIVLNLHSLYICNSMHINDIQYFIT